MSNEEKEEKLKVSHQIADNIIHPMNTVLDMALHELPNVVDEMKARLHDMEHGQSVMAAWPTAETMDKADRMALECATFRAMIVLMEKRQEQMEHARKPRNPTVGEAILRQMGM